MDTPNTTSDARGPAEANPRANVPRVIAILLALCLLYILSIGPAAGLLTFSHLAGGFTTMRLFGDIHRPVMFLGESTPLGEPLEWYIVWWLELGQRLR